MALPTSAYAADKVACAAAAEAGQRLLKDHKLTAAHDKLLLCSSTDCPDIISKDCTQWLGEVERNAASIVVHAHDPQNQPVSDLRVLLDGVVLTEHSSERPLEIDPGTHVLRVEHAGFDPVEQKTVITEGKRGQEVVIALHPPQAAPPPPPPPVEEHASGGVPLLVGSVVVAGVGVVGMGLFTGFALAGMAQQNDMKAPGGCAPNCTGTPELASLQTKYTIANVSLVGGIVGLAAGAAMFIVWMVTHPKEPEKAAFGRLEITF